MLRLLVVMAAVGQAPAEGVSLALAETLKLPVPVRCRARFLSLAHLPAPARAEAVVAVDYLLNAVSRSRTIVRAAPVGDAAAPDLVRIDLGSYADAARGGTFAELVKAWENLASADPYFHLRTQVLHRGKVRTVTVDGGWVDLPTAARLRAETGSLGAVLRADTFVSRVATTPGYYEWAGVSAREDEFFRELGVDLDAINRLAADSAANLFVSEVTGKPRRVIYRPGPLGGNWITKDVVRESPERDPFRNPINFGVQRFTFDASEVFFRRANQLWGMALFNAKGERQDAVPVEIATDHTAPRGHQLLVPPISCIRCHELFGGAGGLQPFADDQTRLGPVVSHEPAVARRITEVYDPPRLNRELNRDREDYAQAVAQATGGASPEEVAQALSSFYAAYVYEGVDLPVAARELGLSEDKAQAVLSGSTDPIVLGLLAGRTVGRGSWEAAFAEAALHAATREHE